MSGLTPRELRGNRLPVQDGDAFLYRIDGQIVRFFEDVLSAP